MFGDHLGSIDVIANESGAPIETLAFDPFGSRRDAIDWQGNPAATPALTTRGFTGHEHVDGTQIVHMNGRIYDPALARFLQPDPIVEAPANGQSWNRYAYVFNNPLTLTDPTGYSTRNVRLGLSLIVAIYTGAWANLLQGWAAATVVAAGGAVSGAISAGDSDGALWGAFSALAFYGVGYYFESAQWAAADGPGVFKTGLSGPGYAAKVLAHGVTGGVMQDLQGGRFGSGFLSAGVTQALSPGIDLVDSANPGFSPARTLLAALVGGTVSHASGDKFATGALTAAFARAFNDEASNSLRVIGDDDFVDLVGDVRTRAEQAGIDIFHDVEQGGARIVIRQSGSTRFRGGRDRHGNSLGIVEWDSAEAALVATSPISRSESRRYQSAALGLIHELGHARQFQTGQAKGPSYERDVIFGVEKAWANYYGEPTRHPSRAHGGIGVEGKPPFWFTRR